MDLIFRFSNFAASLCLQTRYTSVYTGMGLKSFCLCFDLGYDRLGAYSDVTSQEFITRVFLSIQQLDKSYNEQGGP